MGNAPGSNGKPSQELPALLDPHGPEFREWYEHGVGRHKEIFGSDEWSHRVNPLLEPERLDGLIDAMPPMHRNLLSELATLMAEYRRNGNLVQKERLWRHQEALVAEFVQSLALPKNGRPIMSTEMEEAAGTGKTRVMGLVVQAVSRLMVRDLFQGNVLMLVRRKGLVMQQAIGREDRMAAALSTLDDERSPGTKAFRYMETATAHHPRSFLAHDAWLAMWNERYKGPDDAKKRLTQRLREDRLWGEFSALPNHAELLDDAAALLSSHAVPVNAPFGNERELLRFEPPRSSKGVERGDLLFGVHKRILDTRGAVFVQSSIDWDHVNEDEVPTRDTRIALLSYPSLYQDRAQARIGDFLSNVGVIVLDEACRTPASSLQGMVERRGGEKPFVYAATAWDPAGKLQFDSRLSSLSSEKAIDLGVLKPQRLHVFPENLDDALAPGSIEAAEQLVREYGRRLEFPAKQHAPQPTDGHVLIMVSGPLVPYVTLRLRQEYGATGTQFVSYDDNTDERNSLMLQAAMNGNGPRICVVGSSSVIDSYDWTKLRSAWLCVPENDHRRETMKRFFGRQAHSRQQDGYFVQQRFLSPQTVTRTAWNAYHPALPVEPDGSLRIVEGQHFLGEEKAASEQPLAKRMAGEASLLKIPSAAERKTMAVPDARYPIAVTTQRELNVPVRVAFPPAIMPFAPDRAYLAAFAKANGIPNDVDELSAAVDACGAKGNLVEALKSAVIGIRLRSMPSQRTRLPRKDVLVADAPKAARGTPTGTRVEARVQEETSTVRDRVAELRRRLENGEKLFDDEDED